MPRKTSRPTASRTPIPQFQFRKKSVGNHAPIARLRRAFFCLSYAKRRAAIGGDFGEYKNATIRYSGREPQTEKKRPARRPRSAMRGLSLYPDNILCAGAKAAGCMADCLSEQGRGRFDNVREARQRKAAYLHNDRAGFLEQLHRELTNFTKLCQRTGERGAVRLNVFSDVKWERYGIPQAHPELLFVDYSKQAARLGKLPRTTSSFLVIAGGPNTKTKTGALSKPTPPWR